MRNPCSRLRTQMGALLVLLAACGSSNSRRPPNVGTGTDLVQFVQPGLYGVREIAVVGIEPDLPPPIDGESPNAAGLMPPRIDADLRLDTTGITFLDGLDVAVASRRDDPEYEVFAYRNTIDAQGVVFELDRRSRHEDGEAYHVQLALAPAAPGRLAGTLRYARTAAKTGVREGASYRLTLELRTLSAGN